MPILSAFPVNELKGFARFIYGPHVSTSEPCHQGHGDVAGLGHETRADTDWDFSCLGNAVGTSHGHSANMLDSTAKNDIFVQSNSRG